jgi:hypothetical protein
LSNILSRTGIGNVETFFQAKRRSAFEGSKKPHRPKPEEKDFLIVH